MYSVPILAGILLLRKNSRGSILLWMLVVVAVALSVGSYGLRLRAQRQLMISQRYQLARASQNAENGLLWARRTWLNMRMQAAAPALPFTLKWSLSSGGGDNADINISRSGTEWKVECIGYFGTARRNLSALFPDPLKGDRMPLAISGRLYGQGKLVVNDEPSMIALDFSQVTAIELSVEDSHDIVSRAGLRTMPALPVGALLGDYREDGAGESISLLTLPRVNIAEYAGIPVTHMIACQGTLFIGSDPLQTLILEEGRFVLRASRIVMQGQVHIPSGSNAELWMLADHEIVWHKGGELGAPVALAWTSGTARFIGAHQARWSIAQMWANDVELHGAELVIENTPLGIVPDEWLPLSYELPRMRKWHYKDMLRT